jgi:hypothetical protein
MVRNYQSVNRLRDTCETPLLKPNSANKLAHARLFRTSLMRVGVDIEPTSAVSPHVGGGKKLSAHTISGFAQTRKGRCFKR